MNTDERGCIHSNKSRERLKRLCHTECLSEKISISKCEEINLSWWGRQTLYLQVHEHFSLMSRNN